MTDSNKILIQLYLPLLEKEYDLFIPINKRIGTVKQLIEKSLSENNDLDYKEKENTNLYSKDTGKPYDVQLLVKDTDMKNGSKIVLI